MCCCTRLHRHQIHLISYGCVSFGLITTGLVFTVFAIFQKDSQIGKVWLAGPTTMVVGLVLCGKVIIDWGPAMLHAREGSIDSRLMDQMNNPMSRYADQRTSGQILPYQHEPKCNGGGPTHTSEGPGPPRVGFEAPTNHRSLPPYGMQSRDVIEMNSYHDSPSCLIYSQYDSSLTNLNGFQSLTRSVISGRNSVRLSNTNSNSPAHSSSIEVEVCDCSQYGSIRRALPPFQGESFVLNERSYLI